MTNNRLEELNIEKNLKSKDIAKALNISASKYSEWKNNRIPIPTNRLIELADYYKINIDYLLNLTDKRIVINHKTKIDLKDIGIKLKRIRKKQHLSLRSLGEILNVSFTALGYYERGERLIKSDTLISICKLSNTSIDDVLGRK